LALMRALKATVQMILHGLVGRCLKKGWIRYDALERVYVLIDVGRTWLAQDGVNSKKSD
jgi:hypothetical protein